MRDTLEFKINNRKENLELSKTDAHLEGTVPV